jgi:hypothetical protein
MVSSGMLCHVGLVRTDVAEEPSASFIRVTTIGELGTMLAVTSNRLTLQRNTKYFVFLRSMHQLLVTASLIPSSLILVTLMKDALSSPKRRVLTRATWHNIPEDTTLQISFKAMGPGVYSASNRNEYQKHKNVCGE